jgi:nucleotide-binding universal stress UspA family protein
MSKSTAHRGIVVGVDGSPASKVAVGWAAREAAMRNVSLTLVHVIPTVRMWPEEVPTPLELERLYENQAEGFLRDARKVAEEATSGSEEIQLDTKLLTGAVLPSLVDLSKDAELVVVGCRGLGAIARRLLGSISWGLIHHAHCPVAVIHDEDPLMPFPVEQAPVVVGIDGSPASESATEVAFDEASRRGVELVAVHAWSDYAVDELPGVEWSDVQMQAEETLAERLAGWQERYPDVTVRRVVVLRRPAHELLDQAEAAQLVVVGSHGRGGFAGMLLGSVSSAVAESARMPVIVARSS